MSEAMPTPQAPVTDVRAKPVPEATGLAPGTVADWLAWAQSELGDDSDSPRADAEILLATLLGVARSTLPIRNADEIETATVLRYAAWIERRRLGEPVAYIAGRQGFWSIDLIVDSTVLIPRPDTETLVEWALAIARGTGVASIADLGTGSGAIALALAHELAPGTRIVATDASEAALSLARENARALNLEHVRFLHGDWFDALTKDASAQPRPFDLIVSNPPYIAEGDPHLSALRFEPRLALSGGADGLGALGRIIHDAPMHLGPRGWLLLEHGHDQGEAVRGLLQDAGFAGIETRRDFGGNERVSGGRRGDRTTI